MNLLIGCLALMLVPQLRPRILVFFLRGLYSVYLNFYLKVYEENSKLRVYVGVGLREDRKVGGFCFLLKALWGHGVLTSVALICDTLPGT